MYVVFRYITATQPGLIASRRSGARSIGRFHPGARALSMTVLNLLNDMRPIHLIGDRLSG